MYRPVSHALQDPQETALGQKIAQHASAIGARHDSAFRLLGGTEAAYTSRLALVDAAQKTLDLQYYAILVDESTGQFVLRLREAAARGVRVRILLDDFNTTGANAQFLRLAFEPNIQIRLFNPLPGSRRSLVGRLLGSLGNLEQAQRRMHNKMFIADNAIGITGGRNLGDAYFGQGTDSNFIDLDVLAAGRIVRQMSASFDAYWNNELAYPVQSLLSPDELDALRPTSAAPVTIPDALHPDAAHTAQPAAEIAVAPLDLSPARLTWAPSLLLVDKADKIAAEDVGTEDTVVDGLLRLMERTQHDLFIVSPYFVPGDAMMAVFAKLRESGVRVRVLTNSLAATDAPLAHVGYARYRERLLDMGVELYEMRAEFNGGASAMSFGSTVRRVASQGSESSPAKPASLTGSGVASRASLHAKTLVLDESLLVVGSMNLDLRSQLQNSEVALLIRSRSLARQALELAAPVLRDDAYHVALKDGQLVWYAPDGQSTTGPGEPDAGKGLQLMLRLIGPFAPDEML
ncbi:phosphatidylserine/phosphatidylglycerophosphate/cardiolipin synthase family protein [Pseudorhodoferax sp. Leaf267]|uniref:phospholipase D-like domain-containing protein n=1 Tax=Pseudorhodoferax sp. Leaf267 TaxID=1736316 RepID=UPI00350F5A57